MKFIIPLFIVVSALSTDLQAACETPTGPKAEFFRMIADPATTVTELTSFMKENELSPTAVDQNCRLPLYLAIRAKRVDFFDLFYAAMGSPNVNSRIKTADSATHRSVYYAALRGDSWPLVERVRTLGGDLQKDQDVGPKKYTELWVATWSAGPHVIQKLMEEQPLEATKTDPHGKTLLMNAAETNPSVDVIKILLRYGADPNFEMPLSGGLSSPLAYAVGGNSIQIVDTLIRAGARIKFVSSADGWPLIINALINSPEMAQHLIDLGAPVNVYTKEGKTPLMYAAECYGPWQINRGVRCREKIQVLLNAKADRTASGPDGTAQQIAYRMGAPDDVVALLAP